MAELEIIAKTYFVREEQYRIEYDKWDSWEVLTESKSYGPYESKRKAEQQRQTLKKQALGKGWEESNEEYKLLYRKSDMWITDEMRIVLDERKESLGGLEKYLKKNQWFSKQAFSANKYILESVFMNYGVRNYSES